MHFVCDFTQKAVLSVYSTMLKLNGLFRIPELKEELGVRVFAKLGA